MNQSQRNLWQKSWWELRMTFWTSLATISLLAVLLMYGISGDSQWAGKLQRDAAGWNEETRQALPALIAFQGRVWALWFKGGMEFLLPYIAMVWATLAPGCANPWTGVKLDAARLFVLSLPVSRRRILLTQAAMNCLGLWLATAAASLLIPALAFWKGQWFSAGDALIFASLAVVGALVFYFLGLLMTVVFDSGLKSLLFCMAVFAVTLPSSRWVESHPRWHINRLLGGEDYFLHGQIPWLALIVCLLVSALLLFVTVRIFERRDF